MKTPKRRHYTEAFKANAVRRMSAPGQSIQELAEELELRTSLLYRWRRKAGTRQTMAKQESDDVTNRPRRPQDWTSEEKLAAVLESQGLTEEQLGGFVRQRGLHRATLDEWREQVMRAAKAELGGRGDKAQATAEAKRIRELEREVARKDKALAETAALLVLQKKSRALLGGGDDDTEPRSGP